MIKEGDTLVGTVLEVKRDSAIVKFSNRAIEVKLMTDLKEGEKIKVRVKGWYKGKLLFKLLGEEENLNTIDVKV
ncbi:hypothetical protein [Halonatronum saccharophilum]|uniref:hypothetical protein n=1 Tax=Halonatronum saccharophilum TaxID=150060 RepID=UPI0004884054|nr:hypothetical protein [Halonatronum saccharophilum]